MTLSKGLIQSRPAIDGLPLISVPSSFVQQDRAYLRAITDALGRRLGHQIQLRVIAPWRQTGKPTTSCRLPKSLTRVMNTADNDEIDSAAAQGDNGTVGQVTTERPHNTATAGVTS